MKKLSLALMSFALACGTTLGIAQAQNAPKINVAIVASVKPLIYVDENGKPAGLIYEIEEAIGKKLGAEMTFTVASFESIIPGVQSGKFDMGSGVAYTEERAKVIDIMPFYRDIARFVKLADKGKEVGETMADLCGVRIGTFSGTIFGRKLDAIAADCRDKGHAGSEVLFFPATAGAMLALQSDKVDIISVLEGTTLPPGTAYTGPSMPPDYTGIALKKDGPLTADVRQALLDIMADGTYAQILEKFGFQTKALEPDDLKPR